MKLDNSFSLLSRAEKIIPVQSQTFSKGWRYFPKGVSPIYIKEGSGCKVTDVDDNRYIDYILGLGPITLGYNYQSVNDAILAQLKLSGIIFSLPHPLEVELAELLVDIIPCAEMVRFTKTGSEATSAAIKAARAYTGREKIASCGYHGWHDWASVATDASNGIPNSYSNLIIKFEYNDIQALNDIVDRNKLAAIIMEPVISQPPKNGFLEAAKTLAHKNGAVLIFDEVVTGFRWALGGAQEYFGVTPDMATFGKGMANGMPLNAVVGKRELMQQFEWGNNVFFSSTFGGECLSLAAGLATIKRMRDWNTIKHCWDMGQKFMDGLTGIGIRTTGYPCRPIITTKFSPKEKALFIQEYIKGGILIHSQFAINMCYSHKESDITRSIEAIEGAMYNVNKAKFSEDWSTLKGEISDSPPFRRI